MYQISSQCPGFHDELIIYLDMFQEYKSKAEDAISANNYKLAEQLEKDGSTLMAQIIQSKMYSDFCKFKENMESCSHVNLNEMQI